MTLELFKEWTFWAAALAWTFIFGYATNALTPLINARLARSWAWFKRRRKNALIARYRLYRAHYENGSLIFLAVYRAFLVLFASVPIATLILMLVVATPPRTKPLAEIFTLNSRLLLPAIAGFVAALLARRVQGWVTEVFFFGMDPEAYRWRTLHALRRLDPEVDQASLAAHLRWASNSAEEREER